MTAHLGPGARRLVLVPGSALQRVAETGGGLAAALRPAVEDLGDSPRQLELPRPDVAQDGGPVRAGLTEINMIVCLYSLAQPDEGGLILDISKFTKYLNSGIRLTKI